jgi:protein O-mannosyl-transferase
MRRRGLTKLAAVALALLTAAAYWPALRGSFVWDDDGHVTSPELQSLHGLARIWFEPGATQQYYPVLHSLFWVEHRLWGDLPLGYHVANLLLHLAVCLLLYRVLRRLEVPGALLAAAVFALHPVAVESVAWISEQKNTLSTVFYLGAALAYLDFDERRRPADYALASGLFILALLSKSVTASLPAAILVVLWWRRGRISLKADVAPLAPWFGLSAAAAVVTPWIEEKFVGAHGAAFSLGPGDRLVVAGRALWFYLGKIVWPSDLVFIYPRWTIDAREASQYLCPSAAILALVLLFMIRKRSRGPLAAGLLFVGALFPALGFVNVYPFVFSFVADHFQYLALVAMIPALCAALVISAGRLAPGARRFSLLGAAGITVVLAGLTWRQCGNYRNLETFYRSILAKNPSSWLAHDNLGVVLVRRGQLDEAVGHYKEAIRLNPDYPEAYNNYGNVLAETRHWDAAAAAFAGALRARPSFVAAEINWGMAMNDAGRFREAEAHFRRVLDEGRGDSAVHYGLANALANSGRLAEAIPEYRESLREEPNSPEAHANLGLALVGANQFSEAIAEIGEAIRLRPGYAEAHDYYGVALAQSGRLEDAAAEFRAALRINPRSSDVHYHLGVTLRKLGRLSEAEAEFAAANPGSGP